MSAAFVDGAKNALKTKPFSQQQADDSPTGGNKETSGPESVTTDTEKHEEIAAMAWIKIACSKREKKTFFLYGESFCN